MWRTLKSLSMYNSLPWITRNFFFQFFIHNNSTTKSTSPSTEPSKRNQVSQCPSTSQIISTESSSTSKSSRRNSLDLYEEAATILGLTCSQTDSCKCIECQVHTPFYICEIFHSSLSTIHFSMISAFKVLYSSISLFRGRLEFISS